MLTITDRAHRILDDLGSHHPTAERRATRRLVALGSRITPVLIWAVRSHRNAHARGVAASALVALDKTHARPAILRALADPAMTVRLRALIALDRDLWSERAAGAVMRLVDDPSGGIRNNAIAALARHRERRAASVIRRRLHDERSHVRLQAERALGLLKTRRSATT